MMKKLSQEDFYHQFHNLEHHYDSMDADRSIMDTMSPREFYRATGGRVDFKTSARNKAHAKLMKYR